MTILGVSMQTTQVGDEQGWRPPLRLLCKFLGGSTSSQANLAVSQQGSVDPSGSRLATIANLSFVYNISPETVDLGGVGVDSKLVRDATSHYTPRPGPNSSHIWLVKYENLGALLTGFPPILPQHLAHVTLLLHYKTLTQPEHIPDCKR